MGQKYFDNSYISKIEKELSFFCQYLYSVHENFYITCKGDNYRIFEGAPAELLEPILDDEKLELEIDSRERCLEILFGSFIVSVVSYFEYTLDKLCEWHEYQEASGVLLSDFKDDGVKRSINYLKKVAKLEIPNGKSRQEIFYLIKIRNCIVHASGELSENKDLNLYIEKKHPILDIREEFSPVPKRFIIITYEYCNESIDNIKSFLQDLLKLNMK